MERERNSAASTLNHSTSSIFPILLVDFVAIAFVYFMPHLVKITGIPLYLIDPMRLWILTALIFTNKPNTLVLVLVLPLLSHLVGGHPHIVKTILLSIELLLNVSFLYYLEKHWTVFWSAFVSIIISKSIYYILKFMSLNFGWIQGDLLSTPLWIQAVMTTVMSFYVTLFYRFYPKKIKNK